MPNRQRRHRHRLDRACQHTVGAVADEEAAVRSGRDGVTDEPTAGPDDVQRIGQDLARQLDEAGDHEVTAADECQGGKYAIAPARVARRSLGSLPANAIGAEPTVDIGALDDAAGPTTLDEAGTHSPNGPGAPPPREVAPLRPVKALLKKPVEPVSRLLGVGTCKPAKAVAALAGAVGSVWSPIRTAPAATAVPAAIAAVSIRIWVGEDFRECFDMGASF